MVNNQEINSVRPQASRGYNMLQIPFNGPFDTRLLNHPLHSTFEQIIYSRLPKCATSGKVKLIALLRKRKNFFSSSQNRPSHYKTHQSLQ